MAFRFDDHGRPLDAAELDAMITSWRLMRSRLERSSEPFVIEHDLAASQERLTRLLWALSELAAGMLLTCAALDLGEDSTAEEQAAYARDHADRAIEEQMMAAHAIDLGEPPH
jgi:hypothetical protein